MQCAHFRRALLQRFQLCSGLRLPPLTGAACTEVHNARLLDPAPTLDSHGFQLVEAPTELDLQDTDQVTGAFYAECRALIERVTGCAAVRDGRHEYRRSPGLPTPNGSGGGFAGGIHADMSCAIELNWQPGDDERHFQSLNVWRSAEPEADIEMMPLALCAMDSVDPEDIVYGDGQNTSDIMMYMKVVNNNVVYNPAQMWFYFPRIKPWEVLLFRALRGALCPSLWLQNSRPAASAQASTIHARRL